MSTGELWDSFREQALRGSLISLSLWNEPPDLIDVSISALLARDYDAAFATFAAAKVESGLVSDITAERSDQAIRGDARDWLVHWPRHLFPVQRWPVWPAHRQLTATFFVDHLPPQWKSVMRHDESAIRNEANYVGIVTCAVLHALSPILQRYGPPPGHVAVWNTPIGC